MSATPVPQPDPSLEGPLGRAVLWTAAAALLTRLVYFVEHLASPFFQAPILDARHYDAVARALVEGQALHPYTAGFRPLLYPGFLAFLYRLGGDWDRVLAVATQHLLGVMTAVLVALFAGHLFRRPAAGLLAGLLYALAGPPLFFEGELLATAFATFVAALHLWLLGRLDEGGIDRWAGAGAVAAVAAQLRPNLIVVLAAYPALALFVRGGERRRVLRGAAAGLAAALLVLALFGHQGRSFTGGFRLLPGAGGVNLYLGNKRGADGLIPRQERAVTYGESYRDSVEVFSEETFREARGLPPDAVVDAGEASRYWLGRTWDEVRAAPAAAAGRLLRKSAYLAWNREVPNIRSYDFVLAEESPVLRFLPVRWWLLLALVPAGLAAAWRHGDRRRLFWLVACGALYAAGVVLFFVNSRYRLPLWPSMAILAGGGLTELLRAARSRDLRRLAVLGGAAVLLAALALANLPPTPVPGFARDHFFRSIALLERGDPAGAIRDAEASLALEPDEPASLNQLGNARLAAGRPEAARTVLERAVALAPAEPRAWNSLGVARERTGDPAGAEAAYRRALALAPDYQPARENLDKLAAELTAGGGQSR